MNYLISISFEFLFLMLFQVLIDCLILVVKFKFYRCMMYLRTKNKHQINFIQFKNSVLIFFFSNEKFQRTLHKDKQLTSQCEFKTFLTRTINTGNLKVLERHRNISMQLIKGRFVGTQSQQNSFRSKFSRIKLSWSI